MTKVEIPLKTKAEASEGFIQNEKDVEVRVRAPKKVLHFSDGTLEEYSDDEEDQVDRAEPAPVDEVSPCMWQWQLRCYFCPTVNGSRTGSAFFGQVSLFFLATVVYPW